MVGVFGPSGLRPLPWPRQWKQVFIALGLRRRCLSSLERESRVDFEHRTFGRGDRI